MSSDVAEDIDFFQKFDGYTIPKKKVEPGQVAGPDDGENDEDEPVKGSKKAVAKELMSSDEEDGEIKESEQRDAKTRSPKKKRAANSIYTPPQKRCADPLGLEPVITYGEAKGTRFTALQIFASKYDGELPEEVLSQCNDNECHLCGGVQFNGSLNVARSHYSGKNHAKTFKAALQDWYMKDPVNNIMPTLKPTDDATSLNFDENRPDHDETFCHVCNIELSSKIVAVSHYQGQKHAKNLRKRHSGVVEVPHENFPSSNSKRPKLITHLEDSSIISDSQSRQGSGNRFFCLGCKLHFKSQADFATHLQSEEHKSKASSDSNGQESKVNSGFSTPSFSTVPTTDSIDEMLSKLRANPKSAFDCSLCQVQCSSQGTLATHLAGKQHKKKLEMAHRQDNPGMFRCEVCNVEATDQANLDMHFAGKKHQKKVNVNK